MIKKTCKLCDKPRFANTSWCLEHYKEREKEKKANKVKKKKPKAKPGTLRYEKELQTKLMKKNDKLYQEIGRKLYNKSFFGNKYCCLHHIVRKAQGLNTRYDFKNGMPVSIKEHCSIHMAQDCKFEGEYILHKGKKWFNDLQKRRRIVITDKTKFLQDTFEILTNLLEQLEFEDKIEELKLELL